MNPCLEFVRVLCTESGAAGKEAGSTKKKKKKLKSKPRKGTLGPSVTIASRIAVTSSDCADAKTSSDKVNLHDPFHKGKRLIVLFALQGEYEKRQ